MVKVIERRVQKMLNTRVRRNITRKEQVDGEIERYRESKVLGKSGEGTMMEQSPEMIGGAGRQTHLMRSFVSRHNPPLL